MDRCVWQQGSHGILDGLLSSTGMVNGIPQFPEYFSPTLRALPGARRCEVEPDPGLEKVIVGRSGRLSSVSKKGFALFISRKDKLNSKLVKCHLAKVPNRATMDMVLIT